MMSQIISRLYVGDYKYDERDLKRREINYIINVGGTPKDYKHFGYRRHLNDGYNEISEYKKVIQKLEYIYHSGKNILVHCRAGISRSPFIISIFLARLLDIDIDEAIEIVNLKHPMTNINYKMLAGFKQEANSW